MRKLLFLLLVGSAAAYAQVAGDPILHANQTITGAFTAGQLEAARGGTGIDTSASTGVTRVSTGTWTADAGVGHLASSTSADLAGVLSDETGSAAGGIAVFNEAPVIDTSLSQDGDVADAGYLRLQNAALIGWEASPTGTDVTISVNASEQYVFDGLDCSAGDQYITADATGILSCGTDDGTNPLAFTSPEALTLSVGGSVTLTGAANTRTYHTIDINGGGAGTDDWTAVVCTAGSEHVVRAVDDDSTIVVQVTSSADFTMDNSLDRMVLDCNATDTLTELSRSNNGA